MKKPKLTVLTAVLIDKIEETKLTVLTADQQIN